MHVRTEIKPLRDDGLELLERLPASQLVAVHWGMTMAAYPFWGEVAAVTGRLLRLQGSAAAIQIQRRVREIYGERETASRSARYVVSAFHQWGVLKEERDKGVYSANAPCRVSDTSLIGWLMEAYLLSRKESRLPPKSIVETPAFFPFDLQFSAGLAVARNPRLEVDRHGLDEDLVSFIGQSVNKFEIFLVAQGAPAGQNLRLHCEDDVSGFHWERLQNASDLRRALRGGEHLQA